MRKIVLKENKKTPTTSFHPAIRTGGEGCWCCLEVLTEMYLADIPVRHVEDITNALRGTPDACY